MKFIEFLNKKGLYVEAIIDRSAMMQQQQNQGSAELKKAMSRSLNLTREQMPQVPTDCIPLLKAALGHQGLKFVIKPLSPVQMLPSQSDINISKSERMKSQLGTLPDKPLIAVMDGSNTLRIVDGHHKWAALYLLAYELADMGKIKAPTEYTTPTLAILSPKGIDPVIKAMQEVGKFAQGGNCKAVARQLGVV